MRNPDFDISLKELILNNEREGDFTHAKVTDQMISDAESELQVRLPSEYIGFLKKLGQGGFCTFAVLGFRDDGEPCFVDVTESYRRYYRLPLSLVVIEEELDDDTICCIDTTDESIVKWDRRRHVQLPLSDSFAEYLKDRILESIGDMHYAFLRFISSAETMMS